MQTRCNCVTFKRIHICNNCQLRYIVNLFIKRYIVRIRLVPNQPASVSVESQSVDSIKIIWSNPEGGVASYKTVLNGASAVDNELKTDKTFSSLTAGTKYTIEVYAVGGDETLSSVVEIISYTGKLFSDNYCNIKHHRYVKSSSPFFYSEWNAYRTGVDFCF